MINRLFHRKIEEEQFTRLDERIIWGIWASRRLKLAYKMVAAELRVPMSVLVGHVLRQWLVQNRDTLLSDSQKKQELGDQLTKKYITPHRPKE